MFKKFEEFINESSLYTKRNDEKELIKTAIYELAKKSQYHVRYLLTDKNYVRVIVPSSISNNHSVLETLTGILKENQIEFIPPNFNSNHKPARGDDQYLKINYNDLINFGHSIYPNN